MLFKDPSCAADEALAQIIQQRIHLRTCGRIHGLRVEARGDQVIVHGYSPSYYVLQLALVGVHEVFPSGLVELDIQVVASFPYAPEGRNRADGTLPWRQVSR